MKTALTALKRLFGLRPRELAPTLPPIHDSIKPGYYTIVKWGPFDAHGSRDFIPPGTPIYLHEERIIESSGSINGGLFFYDTPVKRWRFIYTSCVYLRPMRGIKLSTFLAVNPPAPAGDKS